VNSGVPDIWNTVESCLEREVQEGAVPGAVLAVGSSEELFVLKAVGAAVVEPEHRTMREDAIFDLASLTKVVATTTGILLLVERGLLSLDQSLLEFFPRWANTAKAGITVRHLLTHTSGLPGWHPLYVWGEGKEQALETISELNLHAPPGERVEYSCLGFIVLGHLIEEITGESLDVFFAKEIAGPLGLASTCYLPLKHLPAGDHARIVPTEKGNAYEAQKLRRADQSYGGFRTGFHPGEVHDGNAWYAMGGVSGNAGLFGTAADLLRFGQMWLRAVKGDGDQLISPVTAELAARDHTPLASSSRGLGWLRQRIDFVRQNAGEQYSAVQYLPASEFPAVIGRPCGELMSARSFGHTGFTGTSIWIDPELDLVVVLLTNRLHPTVGDGIFRLRPLVHNAAAAARARTLE